LKPPLRISAIATTTATRTTTTQAMPTITFALDLNGVQRPLTRTLNKGNVIPSERRIKPTMLSDTSGTAIDAGSYLCMKSLQT